MQTLVRCVKCQGEFEMQAKPKPYVTVCPACGESVKVKARRTILVLAGTHRQFKQHQREHTERASEMVAIIRPEQAEAYERGTMYEIIGTFWGGNPHSIEIYQTVQRRGYKLWNYQRS